MSTAGAPVSALLVTDYFRPLIGGAIRSVELIARHLAARGHRIEIATSWQAGLPPRETIDGVVVHRLRDLSSRARWVSEDPYKHNPPPFPDPEAALRLRRLILQVRPDLVHSYGWISHSVAAALMGTEVPLLLSARDYGNVCALGTLVRDGQLCSGPAPAKCLVCASHRYGRIKGAAAVGGVLAAGPLLRRRVDRVHAVSRFVGDTVNRHLHVPGVSATVIPNFHEPERDAPDPAQLAQLPDADYILFVGAFRRIKGIAELLAAYARLPEPPPLVLVGTRMADTPVAFPDSVTVINDASHATVDAIWQRALFGVAPSILPEALGNVVHEAMSHGRAMIGTRPGGHEDMIDHEDTGLLVLAGDVEALAQAMTRLIVDEPLRRTMGERALVKAREFEAEAVVPRLEQLYRETASARGRVSSSVSRAARNR